MSELQDKATDSYAKSRRIDPDSKETLSKMFSDGSPKPDGGGKVVYSTDAIVESGGSPKPDDPIKVGYSTEL